MLETLYKIDSKDKIREWVVTVEDFGGYAEILVSHGEKDGKKQIKTTKISNGKNIGKKNETSYLEQAYHEAQSKWNKQIDKGYGLTPVKVFRPMLAHKFHEHPKKVQYPCYVQPKLDGLRCVIEWDFSVDRPIARSRMGKEWKVINHILDNVYLFLRDNPTYVLDGELFTREISFQEICSAISRDTPNKLTKLTQFWCYDIYLKNNPEYNFGQRYELIPETKDCFVKVDTRKCIDKLDVEVTHESFVEEKYEGTIIRNRLGKYKVNGRSHDLLKLKDFQDAEYRIVDKRSDKNDECVFVCYCEKVKESFECKPEGTHEHRVQLLKDKNIGSLLTVRFFEFTDKGLPRFPVGVGVRLDAND